MPSFQQDSATAHTANIPRNCLHCVTILRKRLWPPRSPDLNPCGRPCQNIKSKVTILVLQTTVNSARHDFPDHGNFSAQKALIRRDTLSQLPCSRTPCMYELSFVGHDPASKGNRIPMVRRLKGQVMLGSDYPLTQRHLPDERNPPFRLHENPNNARTNIRARIPITLQFKLKSMSATAAVRIFLSADTY